MKVNSAILTTTSIRCAQGQFRVIKRYLNGVIIGKHDGCYLACYNRRLVGTRALVPVIGTLDAQAEHGWIFPDENLEAPMTLHAWKQALCRRMYLEWRQLLRSDLQHEPEVKLAIEDYSLEDLNVLREHAWFVGLSAHAPLWRVYALIPARIWERSAEFPEFDGQVRRLSRFGAIYDPGVHRLTWR